VPFNNIIKKKLVERVKVGYGSLLSGGCIEKQISGMSLEAGNRRKSLVTLAVTAGYFFSLKKIMIGQNKCSFLKQVK
jgi:hypothetical protein